MVIQSTTEEDAVEGRNVLLKQEVHEGELGHGVLVPGTLFLTSKEFPVLLMNADDHEVTSKNGSLFGQCTAFASIRQQQTTGSDTKSIPGKLETIAEEFCQ